MLGKSISSNLVTGMEQPAQVFFSTKIGGSVKFSVGIVHTFMTHTENRDGLTIQPTIVHSDQATGPVLSYWDYFPIRILDSGTDV